MISQQGKSFSVAYSRRNESIVIELVNVFIVKKSDYLFSAGKNQAEVVINNTIWNAKSFYGEDAHILMVTSPTTSGGLIAWTPKGARARFDFFHIRGPKEGYYDMAVIFHHRNSLDVYITDDFFADNNDVFETRLKISQIIGNENYRPLFGLDSVEHYQSHKNRVLDHRFLLLSCILHQCFPIRLLEDTISFDSTFYYLKHMNFTPQQVIDPSLSGGTIRTNVRNFWHTHFFGEAFSDGFTRFLEMAPSNMKPRITMNRRFAILYQFRLTAIYAADGHYPPKYFYPDLLDFSESQVLFLRSLSTAKIFFFDPELQLSAPHNYATLFQDVHDAGYINPELYSLDEIGDPKELYVDLHAEFLARQNASALGVQERSTLSLLDADISFDQTQLAQTSAEGEQERLALEGTLEETPSQSTQERITEIQKRMQKRITKRNQLTKMSDTIRESDLSGVQQQQVFEESTLGILSTSPISPIEGTVQEPTLSPDQLSALLETYAIRASPTSTEEEKLSAMRRRHDIMFPGTPYPSPASSVPQTPIFKEEVSLGESFVVVEEPESFESFEVIGSPDEPPALTELPPESPETPPPLITLPAVLIFTEEPEFPFTPPPFIETEILLAPPATSFEPESRQLAIEVILALIDDSERDVTRILQATMREIFPSERIRSECRKVQINPV